MTHAAVYLHDTWTDLVWSDKIESGYVNLSLHTPQIRGIWEHTSLSRQGSPWWVHITLETNSRGEQDVNRPPKKSKDLPWSLEVQNIK